ncbi:hypothetical protein [Frankia sp. AiPa1]|uniref:hypothetical protein n=1 Tax=Frankia sp. AiPa1 TaxID=573492 RepID=UPI00202B6D83|nr:hypothetical protein [Frankia sp. AiPa1]MCL9761778.1 hypothetical protein [Frankia sp. AiPa1]
MSALFADLPDAMNLLRTALAGEPMHDVVEAADGFVDLYAMPIRGSDATASAVADGPRADATREAGE